MDNGDKMYNVYGWVYPNTEQITFLGCGDHATALSILDQWMEKDPDHDAWIVSVDEDPNYEDD